MSKEIYRRNLKLYPFYKMISFDLVFYYAFSLVFLTKIKGLSASDVLFADSFFLLFKTFFQVPCTILIDNFGKRNSLIFANICTAIYALLVIGCNGFMVYFIADIVLALGFIIKNVCEANILYDSIPDSPSKRKFFSKLEGRGTALYYFFEAFSSLISGFLYKINPYMPMIICFIFAILSTFLTCLFKHTNLDKPLNQKEVTTTTKYIKSLASAFKYILHSKRLRSLIMFNAVLAGLYPLLATYRRSIFNDINVPVEYIGIIFTIFGILSAISSNKAHKIHKLYRNHTLTVLGIPTVLSVILSGLVIILDLPYVLMLVIVLICFGIQHITRGPFYTLIKQYLSSFATSDMRIKIFSANTLIEGIVGATLSFTGAFLLNVTYTALASVILGAFCTLLLIIVLKYMKKRVGLKPEEYSKKDISFIDVK